VPSGHGTISVRAKTGEVPYRIELTCRKNSSHCRDPRSWLATSASLIINSPANDHADNMSFRGASREIPRYPESDSLANLADSSASAKRNGSKKHELPPLPSSEPSPALSLSLAGLFTHFSDPKLHEGQERSGPEGSLRSTNESIIANTGEEKKVPAEVTRERSTPAAPPEAEAPSGRHLKSNTTNNVIAPGSVKLICPDCVSAPIHDRGPGIARPSAPFTCPPVRPTTNALTSRHEPRTSLIQL
jgi:hypothetical protein